VSELEADGAKQDSLGAEIMGGQGSTTGCSAIGWMDGWMVGDVTKRWREKMVSSAKAGRKSCIEHSEVISQGMCSISEIKF
jgi:hypothetical protein